MLESGVGSIAHAVQLSVAPVFLLTGIAGLLNVMTNRLARAIDHVRKLDADWKSGDLAPSDQDLEQLSLYRRRAILANNAIAACTAAGLLTCVVIAILFIDALLGTRLRWLAGIAYFLSTAALILAFALFQAEIYFGTRTLVEGPQEFSLLARRAKPE